MRRPWSEAVPLLSAHGHAVVTIIQPASRIAPEIPFAVLETPDRVTAKPRAYPDIRRLARWVHRARRGRPIMLETHKMRLRGDKDFSVRRGVSVWLGGEGYRREYLGWCWLSGQGRLALQDALESFDNRGRAR